MKDESLTKGQLSHQSNQTGSSDQDEPVFLVIGRFGKPHGVEGELTFRVLTDFPERLKKGVTIFVGKTYQPMRIGRVRAHNDKLLIGFKEIATREAARLLTNKWVYVRADEIPELPEGEYYHHQLIGMRVVTDEGGILGTLTEILETGANDVYVVRSESGADILLPAIDPVILRIDLDLNQIEVHLIPGLLP